MIKMSHHPPNSSLLFTLLFFVKECFETMSNIKTSYTIKHRGQNIRAVPQTKVTNKIGMQKNGSDTINTHFPLNLRHEYYIK